MEYPKSFEELMTCFKMLPGIGNKGAERMAYAIYDMSEEDVKDSHRHSLHLKKMFILVLYVEI